MCKVSNDLSLKNWNKITNFLPVNLECSKCLYRVLDINI